ncbi:hypothetical protein J2Z23_003476, partial [Lederbergia galactosidilyticus]|nr:hypothetical protein [Lederbergia galactosidilytica]
SYDVQDVQTKALPQDVVILAFEHLR